MIKNYNIDDGNYQIFNKKYQVYSAVKKFPSYAIGCCSGRPSIIGAFYDKHMYNENMSGFPPVFVGVMEDVYVNNIGNFVRIEENDGDEIQFASFFQFSQEILKKALPVKDIQYHLDVDTALVLIRPGDHIFGHWLIDMIPRVWILKKSGFSRNVKFIVRQGIPNFAIEMLNIAGVYRRDIIEVDVRNTLLKIKNGIYVMNLRADQTVHTALGEFSSWWRDRVYSFYDNRSTLGNVKLPKRIYVSRRNWKKNAPNRRCINADFVEEYLRNKLNLFLFHPENYSFIDQVKIFSQAEIIFGEEGSGLHNSLFSPEDSIVVTLRNEKNLGLIQSGLCRSRNQIISAVFGDFLDKENPSRESDFIVGKERLEECMDCLKATGYL